EYKPIEAEQSILSDEAFFCVYNKHSSDANFCFLIKLNAAWELWEQFKRNESMQLSRIYCSVGQPDSLKSEFMGIGQIPTDAVDLWDRHFGNGKLLLDVSFQEADSTKQKFFIECEVEHESSLGTSFVDWFSENATGEIGSFRMKNLGSDRIHFVGINQNLTEKWFTDSSSQVIKKFPLGSRLMLNGNVSADSTCYGFIQQGNLYFSYNSKVLSGLKDYLLVCSKMESSTEFKSLLFASSSLNEK
ncbi:hypothetical protein EBS43_09225, partial [bacterium]|nr:hypothetical protein [bacterium]